MSLAGLDVLLLLGVAAAVAVARIRHRKHAARREAAVPPAPAPAPAILPLSGGRVFDLQGHLVAAGGFPHVDWDAVRGSLVATPFAPDLDAIRRGWLLHLRDALGPQYRVHETEDALALASLDLVTVRALLNYVATTRRRILRVLPEVARFAPGERSIVLVLDDEDTYYRYVSSLHSGEGEFGLSSGMFFPGDCPHFVVKRGDLRSVEPVIAHELTHASLAHLELPLWLDEGLAVNTEARIAGGASLNHTARQLHGKHVAFWDARRIQEFWSGDAFRRADDGQMLSYELARILVREMAGDWPAFAAFLQQAARDDAGDQAARQLLGVDLGESVRALFAEASDEDWSPDRRAWDPAPAARPALSGIPRGTMGR